MLDARRRLPRGPVCGHPEFAARPGARSSAGSVGAEVYEPGRAGGLSRHNEEEISFLGAGMYDHYVPALIDTLLSRSELPPYTPYQPEISQGGLQVMFEFQTAISSHRAAGVERVGVRGSQRGGGGGLPCEARRPSGQSRRASRGCTRTRARPWPRTRPGTAWRSWRCRSTTRAPPTRGARGRGGRRHGSGIRPAAELPRHRGGPARCRRPGSAPAR